MKFRKKNRAAFINFLRAHYERITEATVVGSYPYFMWIDPTSICNLRCPFCPTGYENENRRAGRELHLRNRTMMSRGLFDSVLDEMSEYLFFLGLYNYGEPLLSRDLPYFIKRARQADIFTEIHTNLSITLSDEAMKELLLSGVDVIAASIDGFSQETYQRYRVGGDFALAKSNIERLASLKKALGVHTEIVWMYLVFSFNEHEGEAIEGYCRERGITSCRREACINIGEKPEWLPSYRKKELATGTPSAGHAKEITPSPSGARSCAWHYSYAVVNADGAVSPCCAPWDQADDFGIVVPGKNRFADVWNNELFTQSRGALSTLAAHDHRDVTTICVRCPFGPAVKDQYTPWDEFVLNRFGELRFDDRVLRKAFSLLPRSAHRFARYMRRKGIVTPL